ncbi:MAG: radical SAM protein [Betaproteobacteria bacterium]|nr:radical SAM protein [Betaproteobacteria bacterium]
MSEHSLENYDMYASTPFPKMVVIAFTYVCNALCPGCAYTNSSIRSDYKDTKHMPEGTFKKIADEVGKHGAWLRISGGGEPLIHPEALPLIEYAKQAGCQVGLITNGSLLTRQKAERLMRAGLDMLEFSVDAATAEDYEIVRKGLDFDKLVANVRAAREMRDAQGFKTRIIASAVNQKTIDIDAAERFWSPYVDLFQKRKFLTWGINSLANSADPVPYIKKEDRIPCPIIFDRLLIDSKGRAAFCIYDIAGVTDMGNVNEMSIHEIWTGAKFQDIRQAHLSGHGYDIDICSTCEDAQYRSWKHNYWKIVDVAAESRDAAVRSGVGGNPDKGE